MRTVGIEPTTSVLSGQRSTIELRARKSIIFVPYLSLKFNLSKASMSNFLSGTWFAPKAPLPSDGFSKLPTIKATEEVIKKMISKIMKTVRT